MKKVLAVFGTRPEAIKMCPLVNELKTRSEFFTFVCVTGQHKNILDDVLKIFDVNPDFDLAVMTEAQSLSTLTSAVLNGFDNVLDEVTPDLVLVHGDTTSAFSAALACFYKQIPVGHVEAGLRTYNIKSPFPEEFNRRAISHIASYHFAPTENNRECLLNEGICKDSIFVTGNTVVDALKQTLSQTNNKQPHIKAVDTILFTMHRRENLGEPMISVFKAVKKIAEERDVKFIYPVHPNPAVKNLATMHLAGNERIILTEPLDVLEFHSLLADCAFIITDSGGVQEEATALGKRALVIRNNTERNEGVYNGNITLSDYSEDTVYKNITKLLDEPKYDKKSNVYGEGDASKKIADIIQDILK